MLLFFVIHESKQRVSGVLDKRSSLNHFRFWDMWWAFFTFFLFLFFTFNRLNHLINHQNSQLIKSIITIIISSSHKYIKKSYKLQILAHERYQSKYHKTFYIWSTPPWWGLIQTKIFVQNPLHWGISLDMEEVESSPFVFVLTPLVSPLWHHLLLVIFFYFSFFLPFISFNMSWKKVVGMTV